MCTASIPIYLQMRRCQPLSRSCNQRIHGRRSVPRLCKNVRHSIWLYPTISSKRQQQQHHHRSIDSFVRSSQAHKSSCKNVQFLHSISDSVLSLLYRLLINRWHASLRIVSLYIYIHRACNI